MIQTKTIEWKKKNNWKRDKREIKAFDKGETKRIKGNDD